MPKFLTALRVEKQPDGQWKLIDPLRYRTDLLIPQFDFPNDVIEAPRDFVTDFASIPQIVQSLISADGPWDAPAVLHDLGYRTQRAGITRFNWDCVLWEAMGVEQVVLWKRVAIFAAVRLFGGIPWNENKKKLNQ